MSDIQRPLGSQSTPPVAIDRAGRHNEDDDYDADLDFTNYVNSFRRRWKLVAAAALVGGFAGLGLALSRPAQYQAASTLSIELPNPQSVPTLRASLQSPTLAAETVRELGLDREPHMLTADSFLARHLEIEQVSNTNLFKVKVNLTDPAKAASASQLLATKAIAFNRRLTSSGSGAIARQLKTVVDEAADRLRAAEQQLLKYDNEKAIEVLQEETEALLAQRGVLLQLQVEIASEKAKLAAAQDRIGSQQPVLSANPPGVVAGTSGSVVVNPAYETLARQIATSQTRIAGLERQRRELLAARRPGGVAETRLNELHSRNIERARLEADYDVAMRVYTDLATRYEESRLDVAGVVELIEAAVPPTNPLPRRRLRSAALGLTAGLLLGAFAALVLASPQWRTG